MWLIRAFIVGNPDDRAVLCTSTKAFYITKEDTSNLRLLTQHLKWAASEQDGSEEDIVMQGSAMSHYLLQPKTPDLMALKALLMEAPYAKSKVSSRDGVLWALAMQLLTQMTANNTGRGSGKANQAQTLQHQGSRVGSAVK